jgi:outer membrane protein OmpA-like peptidoglycan-associated protein
MSILSLPAVAQGLYIGLRGGATWLEGANDRPVSGQPPTVLDVKSSYNTGYNIGGFVGWDLKPIRIEGELVYRDNDVDKVTPQGFPTLNGHGDVSSLAGMANGYYDFQVDWPVTPYVGLGIGAARVHPHNVGAAALPVTVHDNDIEFAYQGIVGVSYSISPQFSLSADYRYFSTLDPSYRNSLGQLKTTEYHTHNVMLALTYHFAPPAPAPVATPAAAAPPAAPPAAQQAPAPSPAPARTYLVFFDFDKSEITPEAARILKEAADNAKRSGVSRIVVTGHTDTVGTPQYNQRLSERRAAAVKDFLVREGLTQAQIDTVGKGESQLLVPTGDGVREARNRRAEIVIQ